MIYQIDFEMIQVRSNGISNFLVQYATIDEDYKTLQTVGYGENECEGKPLGIQKESEYPTYTKKECDRKHPQAHPSVFKSILK